MRPDALLLVVDIQNDFLPAEPTTQVEYRANLPNYPLTPGHDTDIQGSELIDPAAPALTSSTST